MVPFGLNIDVMTGFYLVISIHTVNSDNHSSCLMVVLIIDNGEKFTLRILFHPLMVLGWFNSVVSGWFV
jgi:hypothetical protein